jgi:hypothetical protein
VDADQALGSPSNVGATNNIRSLVSPTEGCYRRTDGRCPAEQDRPRASVNPADVAAKPGSCSFASAADDRSRSCRCTRIPVPDPCCVGRIRSHEPGRSGAHHQSGSKRRECGHRRTCRPWRRHTRRGPGRPQTKPDHTDQDWPRPVEDPRRRRRRRPAATACAPIRTGTLGLNEPSCADQSISHPVDRPPSAIEARRLLQMPIPSRTGTQGPASALYGAAHIQVGHAFDVPLETWHACAKVADLRSGTDGGHRDLPYDSRSQAELAAVDRAH